jgi:hypothetical protein
MLVAKSGQSGQKRPKRPKAAKAAKAAKSGQSGQKRPKWPKADNTFANSDIATIILFSPARSHTSSPSMMMGTLYRSYLLQKEKNMKYKSLLPSPLGEGPGMGSKNEVHATVHSTACSIAYTHRCLVYLSSTFQQYGMEELLINKKEKWLSASNFSNISTIITYFHVCHCAFTTKHTTKQ